MPEKKKSNFVKLTSPAGVAIFPHLQTPDTKFKDEGEYRVRLKLGPENGAFLDRIRAESERCFEEEKAKLLAGDGKAKAAAKALQLGCPITPEVDEDGNETGSFLVSFKRNAVQKTRRDGKVVKETDVIIPIFDGAGNRIPPNVEVWGGSTIRVSFFVGSYYAAAAKSAGATLKILAVQVIDLVTKGGGKAEDFGFETDGDAVVQSPAPAADADEAPADDGGADSDSGADF